jgi:hypothetical protein
MGSELNGSELSRDVFLRQGTRLSSVIVSIPYFRMPILFGFGVVQGGAKQRSGQPFQNVESSPWLLLDASRERVCGTFRGSANFSALVRTLRRLASPLCLPT